MRHKSRYCIHYFLTSILIFLSLNGFGQKWTKTHDGNSFFLRNLFYHDLKAFFKGLDTDFYALTAHKPDAFWEKINEGKSQLVLSKITKTGEINLVKTLNEYASRPILRFFNNKYYMLDNEFKVMNKRHYYMFYVYNSTWELESQVKILELPHQMGFTDFAVNQQGQLFFLTDPYFNEHKQSDFKGCYLVKYSPDGAFMKKELFAKSYSSSLNLSNDRILLQLNHQKLVYPFYQTDSIIQISCDSELNYAVVASTAYVPKAKNIDKEVFLSDGDKVVFIDSTYALTPYSLTSTFKIALTGKRNERKWTIEPSERWIFFTPKPLQNGNFMVQVDKRWDSTCLVIFDKTGKQTSVKSFLMNADTRIERFRFIDYFEVSKNEIWIFYAKIYPTREEEIYFERLLL